MRKRSHHLWMGGLLVLSSLGCANRNSYSPYPTYPQYQAYPYGYGQPGPMIQPSASVGGPVPTGVTPMGAPIGVPGTMPTAAGAIPTYPVMPGTAPAGQYQAPPGMPVGVPPGYQYPAPPNYGPQPWIGK